MSTESLEANISAVLAGEVRVRPQGHGEVQVQVPFFFPHGDGFVVYVRDIGDGRFEVTDKAHTLQHMSYHVDTDKLRSGTRGGLLEQIRRRHSVEDRAGELVREAIGAANIGESVFAFVQALIQVSDLRLLDREIVRSTFREDLAEVIQARFPDAIVGYFDPTRDPEGHYPIDFLLNGASRPVAVFGITSDESALAALVTAKQYAEWHRPLKLVAVESDQEQLTRRNVAWLSDTFDKQFSTLQGNEQAIAEYLEDERAMARMRDSSTATSA
jgi:hypothetical protein